MGTAATDIGNLGRSIAISASSATGLRLFNVCANSRPSTFGTYCWWCLMIPSCEAGQRREQPLAHIADLVLDLTFLPAGGRRAGDRLKQVVIGQAQEAAIEFSLFASEDGVDDGLEVVVDEASRHTAKESEGPVVCL